MTRKIKLTRANKSILLKALAPYYYQEKALGHNTENPGRLILKIVSVPADKKATFSTEEIRLMRITISPYRPTLKREFCWFCTVASKARKRLLVVVTTGFSVFYGASAQ